MTDAALEDDEKEALERKLERKQDELKNFEDDSETQVERRLSELADGIEVTTDRTPTHPDNRSMHEHLVKLKTGIENDREAFVRWRIGQLESAIEELESELEELE